MDKYNMKVEQDAFMSLKNLQQENKRLKKGLHASAENLKEAMLIVSEKNTQIKKLKEEKENSYDQLGLFLNVFNMKYKMKDWGVHDFLEGLDNWMKET